MKRILVTGGSGFIGRQCLPLLLEAGYEVHAVHLEARPEPAADVAWHRVDLLEPSAASRLVDQLGPTHLLHLAWHSAAPEQVYAAEPNRIWVEASERLLRAFARCGSRAVVAGTSAEYDWTQGTCRELDTPLLPNSLYGACKLECQQRLGALADRAGLRLAWARIFNAYGPFGSSQRLIPAIVRAQRAGGVARLSACTQIRDFIHTRDVALALIALLESDHAGPVNIGSGRGVAVRELVGQVCEALGAHACVAFGAAATPDAAYARVVADVDRLQAWTGLRATLALERGVAETVAWWRRQLALERA